MIFDTAFVWLTSGPSNDFSDIYVCDIFYKILLSKLSFQSLADLAWYDITRSCSHFSGAKNAEQANTDVQTFWDFLHEIFTSSDLLLYVCVREIIRVLTRAKEQAALPDSIAQRMALDIVGLVLTGPLSVPPRSRQAIESAISRHSVRGTIGTSEFLRMLVKKRLETEYCRRITPDDPLGFPVGTYAEQDHLSPSVAHIIGTMREKLQAQRVAKMQRCPEPSFSSSLLTPIGVGHMVIPPTATTSDGTDPLHLGMRSPRIGKRNVLLFEDSGQPTMTKRHTLSRSLSPTVVAKRNSSRLRSPPRSAPRPKTVSLIQTPTETANSSPIVAPPQGSPSKPRFRATAPAFQRTSPRKKPPPSSPSSPSPPPPPPKEPATPPQSAILAKFGDFFSSNGIDLSPPPPLPVKPPARRAGKLKTPKRPPSVSSTDSEADAYPLYIGSPKAADRLGLLKKMLLAGIKPPATKGATPQFEVEIPTGPFGPPNPIACDPTQSSKSQGPARSSTALETPPPHTPFSASDPSLPSTAATLVGHKVPDFRRLLSKSMSPPCMPRKTEEPKLSRAHPSPRTPQPRQPKTPSPKRPQRASPLRIEKVQEPAIPRKITPTKLQSFIRLSMLVKAPTAVSSDLSEPDHGLTVDQCDPHSSLVDKDEELGSVAAELPSDDQSSFLLFDPPILPLRPPPLSALLSEFPKFRRIMDDPLSRATATSSSPIVLSSPPKNCPTDGADDSSQCRHTVKATMEDFMASRAAHAPTKEKRKPTSLSLSPRRPHASVAARNFSLSPQRSFAMSSLLKSDSSHFTKNGEGRTLSPVTAQPPHSSPEFVQSRKERERKQPKAGATNESKARPGYAEDPPHFTGSAAHASSFRSGLLQLSTLHCGDTSSLSPMLEPEDSRACPPANIDPPSSVIADASNEGQPHPVLALLAKGLQKVAPIVQPAESSNTKAFPFTNEETASHLKTSSICTPPTTDLSTSSATGAACQTSWSTKKRSFKTERAARRGPSTRSPTAQTAKATSLPHTRVSSHFPNDSLFSQSQNIPLTLSSDLEAESESSLGTVTPPSPPPHQAHDGTGITVSDEGHGTALCNSRQSMPDGDLSEPANERH